MADFLSRDALLAAKFRHEDVEVPEWGGSVRVWEVSALKRLDLQPRNGESAELGLVRFVAACIGDESGPFDVGFPVDRLTSSVFTRLSPVVLRLNVATKKAAEDVRGNSEGGPTGASPTGSP